MAARRVRATEPGERVVDLDVPGGQDDLLGNVVRTEIRVGEVLDRLAGAHGLSAADYLVLGTVRRSPGHRSAPSALCAVLGRTSGGMTLTIDRLERAGWLRRLPDPDDRRRVVVEATAEGLALAAAVNDDLHAWEQGLGLSADDRRTIAASLRLLTAALTR